MFFRANWILFLCVTLAAVSGMAQSFRVLDARSLHLRSGGVTEWDWFANKTPDGARYDLEFAARRNAAEASLWIRQDDVKLNWGIELNGKRLGELVLMESSLEHSIAVPPGALVDGVNRLSVIPPSGSDDIVIGEIRLDLRSRAEVLSEGVVEIQVNGPSGCGMPCRITVLIEDTVLAPVHAFPGQQLAVRPGVVYSPDGAARLGLRLGAYTVHATRGPEFGLATTRIQVRRGQTQVVLLRLEREVLTPGLVSCDTHIHTLTHSGHGDASVEERVTTLAGEGIELPVATDHEHLTEYSATALRMGVDRWFTPVVGCETTTAQGHFNSFPRAVGSRVPDRSQTDWSKLIASLRVDPGAPVVILNHPRNVHNSFQPFAPVHFNSVTGENLRGFEFEFDAIEVLNSSALQSDWMVGFRDWFALLNHGYRVTAVGSSDGHDVSRYIVGQGRTYIECDDSDPAAIDVEAACRNLLAGRALVSMGLITQLKVDGKYTVGDLAPGTGDFMTIEVNVMGPSWIRADQVELFANGSRLALVNLESGWIGNSAEGNRKPFHQLIEWHLPRPGYDVHLVAIATGPPVTEPYWAIARPYQPSSTAWHPRVVGATNPVWIDGDGDGAFTAAREYARRLIASHGLKIPELIRALNGSAPGVAAQVAGFCHASGIDLKSKEVSTALVSGSRDVRAGFESFLRAMP